MQDNEAVCLVGDDRPLHFIGHRFEFVVEYFNHEVMNDLFAEPKPARLFSSSWLKEIKGDFGNVLARPEELLPKLVDGYLSYATLPWRLVGQVLDEVVEERRREEVKQDLFKGWFGDYCGVCGEQFIRSEELVYVDTYVTGLVTASGGCCDKCLTEAATFLDGGFLEDGNCCLHFLLCGLQRVAESYDRCMPDEDWLLDEARGDGDSFLEGVWMRLRRANGRARLIPLYSY
jgi:hypothetical protein